VPDPRGLENDVTFKMKTRCVDNRGGNIPTQKGVESRFDVYSAFVVKKAPILKIPVIGFQSDGKSVK